MRNTEFFLFPRSNSVSQLPARMHETTFQFVGNELLLSDDTALLSSRLVCQEEKRNFAGSWVECCIQCTAKLFGASCLMSNFFSFYQTSGNSIPFEFLFCARMRRTHKTENEEKCTTLFAAFERCGWARRMEQKRKI